MNLLYVAAGLAVAAAAAVALGSVVIALVLAGAAGVAAFMYKPVQDKDCAAFVSMRQQAPEAE